MAKLFIVGFPKEFQQIALVELFSIHGTVNTVTLVTDQQTGQPKGYGFITMNDDPGALRAIDALNGTTMQGRTISVRFADEKPANKSRTDKSANPRRDHNQSKRPRRNY
jgi:RNA recognition motif-containing protein